MAVSKTDSKEAESLTEEHRNRLKHCINNLERSGHL